MRVALYFCDNRDGMVVVVVLCSLILVTGEGWWCVLVELGWFGVLVVIVV